MNISQNDKMSSVAARRRNRHRACHKGANKETHTHICVHVEKGSLVQFTKAYSTTDLKLVEQTVLVVFNKRGYVLMILPQVHLRKPCYDFYFL